MNRFNKSLAAAGIGTASDVSVDSLKIRIPIGECKILNKEISERWGEVSESGELATLEFKTKRFIHRRNGCTTSYLIQKRKTSATASESFLIILFNSKILEGHYFQGITKHNARHVYNLLIIQGHVKFSFDSFMNGAVTDCDIKRDFPTAGTAHQEAIIKGFKNLTRLSKAKAKGYTVSLTDRIAIIQWSKRDVATPSAPHVKFYSKDLELEYQSNVFKMASGIECESVLRLEATIKDRDHFRYLLGTKSKDQNFNLCDLLSLSQSELTGMITGMLHKHIEAPIIGNKAGTKGAVNISEAFALALIQTAGKSREELILFMLNFTADKHQQARAKKMIVKLWPDELQTDRNQYTDGIYKFVFGC